MKEMIMRAITRLVWIALGATFSHSVLAQSQGVIADFIVTETREMLDGNRIERTMVGEYSQDIEGRTRFRFNDVAIIADPVADVSWRVDIPRGVAVRQQAQPNVGNEIEHHSDGLPGGTGLALGATWLQDADSYSVAVTELGNDVINGLESTGRKWIFSIPQGTIGNVHPIEIRTESWTSVALGAKLPVLSVTEDPLNGTRRSELRNVRMIEFDAGYFNPDSRYEILDLNNSFPRSYQSIEPDRTR